MKEIEIYFNEIIYNDLYEFTVIQENGEKYYDSVCILKYPGHSVIKDDALNCYEFWLDIKNIVKDFKPNLKTNNKKILEKIHKEYREITTRPNDPWLFNKVIFNEI